MKISDTNLAQRLPVQTTSTTLGGHQGGGVCWKTRQNHHIITLSWRPFLHLLSQNKNQGKTFFKLSADVHLKIICCCCLGKFCTLLIPDKIVVLAAEDFCAIWFHLLLKINANDYYILIVKIPTFCDLIFRIPSAQSTMST